MDSLAEVRDEGFVGSLDGPPRTLAEDPEEVLLSPPRGGWGAQTGRVARLEKIGEEFNFDWRSEKRVGHFGDERSPGNVSYKGGRPWKTKDLKRTVGVGRVRRTEFTVEKSPDKGPVQRDKSREEWSVVSPRSTGPKLSVEVDEVTTHRDPSNELKRQFGVKGVDIPPSPLMSE